MATYKVVDADQLDTDLTSVADAIRSKGGTSGALAFPVGFVNAVNAIELSGGGGGEGGGLPQGVTALSSGTLTLSSDPSSAINVEHGLGVAPNFFAIYADAADDYLEPADFNYYIIAQFGLCQDSLLCEAFRLVRFGTGSNFSQMANVVPHVSSFSNNSTFAVYNSSTYQLKAGVTYHWIAGVVSGI